MKKSIILGMAVIIVLVSASIATANGLPGGGWFTGQTVQNVGSGDANVVVVAYDEAGTEYTLDLSAVSGGPLAEGKSATFLTNDANFDPDIPSGFQGAAIVSSDQPIKAIVNVTNAQLGDLGVLGGLAAGQYQGVDGGNVDTTVVFPLVKNAFGIKTSTFFVQNAGDGPAHIVATYQMRTNPTDPVVVEYTQELDIPYVGQMVVLNPSAATTGGGTPMPASRIGALTVTSDEPIAGVVLEHKTVESPATLLQATRGFTAADYDDTLYVPVMKNRFGYRSTGLQVMNVSGGPIDVTVDYFAAGGTCSGIVGSSKDNLADGESWTFLEDGFPAGCLASAVVNATGNVVGVVNESYFPTVPAGRIQGSTTYSAFPEKAASTVIAAPVFKERFGPKGTGLSIQNVDILAATVTAEFTVDLSQSGTPSGSVYTADFELAPGESLTLLDVNTQSALSWVGSALPQKNLCAVMVTSNYNIVGLANESPWPPGSPSNQDKNNYEAFNLAP